MPKIALEVSENYENVSRPLHMQVIRHIAKLTDLGDDIPIRFQGRALSLPMPGSTLDDKTALNRLPGDKRITIEVDEDYDENFANSTAIRRPEYAAVFKDPALDVWVHPTYQRIISTISVKFTGTDSTQVSTWLATMKRRVSQELSIQMHQLDYHYPIPIGMIGILFEIYRMREAVAGYGDDIGAWFRQCFTPRMDIIANQAGKRNVFAIRESQTGVSGWYDFMSSPPKQESENAAGAVSASFTYTYSYDRVETVVMRYPIVIHNQMMGNDYIDRGKPLELEDIIANASMSMSAIHHFGYKFRGSETWSGTPGIPIPHFDEWLPDNVVTNTSCLMRILMQVDPNNKHALLSLNNMGDWSFPDDVLDYMREEPLTLTKLYENLFLLTLYDGQTLLDSRNLMVAPDLGVSYLPELNERRMYRLVVSLVKDLRMLSPAAIARLTKYGDMVIALLQLIDPSIRDAVIVNDTQFVYGGRVVGPNTLPSGAVPDYTTRPTTSVPVLPEVKEDGTVAIGDLQRAIEYIGSRNSITKLSNSSEWRLVGSFVVKVHGA